MEMTAQHRAKTGAYYTPKIWAELAVAYLSLSLPLPLRYYLFYDPAGGEGALLEALPEDCRKIATTLEAQDVQIMRDKGISAYQYDFLDCQTDELPMCLHLDRKKLIVFTNPPYFKLPASHQCYLKSTYHSNDSVALFLYRIIMELSPLAIAWFGKLDFICAESMQEVYYELIHEPGLELKSTFITPSTSWQGLKGKFPIAFYLAGYIFPQWIGADPTRELLLHGHFRHAEDVIAFAKDYEAQKIQAYEDYLDDEDALEYAPPKLTLPEPKLIQTNEGDCIPRRWYEGASLHGSRHGFGIVAPHWIDLYDPKGR